MRMQMVAERRPSPVGRRVASPGSPELAAWLDGLAALSAAALRPEPITEFLDLVAATACRLVGYDFCGVLLPDEQRAVLTVAGSCGLSPDYVSRLDEACPIPLGGDPADAGPSGRAFHDRTPVIVAETKLDPTFHPWTALADEQGYRSMLSVPILAGERVLGTFNGYRARPHRADAVEVRMASALAGEAALALEQRRLRARACEVVDDLAQLHRVRHESREFAEQSQAIRRRLDAVALRGGGIQPILDALAELVAGPVLADDGAGQPLPSARDNSRPADPSDETPGFSTPIRLDGGVAGRLWMPGSARRLAELDRHAIEHAAVLCGLELRRERTARDVEWRMRGNLLAELLGYPPDDATPLRERATHLGHDLGQPHVLLVARIDPVDPPGSTDPPSEGAENAQLRRLLGIARGVSYPDQRLLATSTRRHVVLLWPQPAQQDPREAARAIRVDVARAMGGRTASVAISGTCTDPDEYPAAYRMARGILQLALLQGRGNATLTVADLGLHGLLLQVNDLGELTRFGDRVLGPVRDYDERHGTALLHTLRVNLETGRDRARTSAALHLHPNTVGIRMRRIESLLGGSLSSPHTLLEVAAALLAADVARSRHAMRW